MREISSCLRILKLHLYEVALLVAVRLKSINAESFGPGRFSMVADIDYLSDIGKDWMRHIRDIALHWMKFPTNRPKQLGPAEKLHLHPLSQKLRFPWAVGIKDNKTSS